MEAVKINEPKTPSINFGKNLTLLIVGRLISNMGTSIYNFALSLYVLDLTGSAGVFSTILALGFIPALLVNLFGGVYVDKSDRKKLIVTYDVLTGVAVFFFTFVLHALPGNVWIIAMFVIILNTLQSVYGLALQSSVPNIVSEDNVSRANSIFQALGAVINIIGPVMGAIAYMGLNADRMVSLQIIFVLNAVSFVISGIMAFLINFKKDTTNKEELKSKSFMQNFTDVFKYLNTQPVIKFLLTFGVIINLVYNPLMMLVVRYVNYNVIKISGLQLSLVQAAAGVGVILGSVIIGMRKSSTGFLKKFFVLLLIQSVIILAWAFPVLPIFAGASKWVITVIFGLILLVIAALNIMQNIPMLSHFQLQIPEELRARVFGVLNTALIATTPVGLWVFGIALEKINWIYIPIVSGIVMFGLTLYGSRNKIFRDFVKELNNSNK